MFIERPGRQVQAKRHRLKVRVPLGHLIRLHAIHVRTGRPLSHIVEEALELYFRDLRADGPAKGRGDEKPPGP